MKKWIKVSLISLTCAAIVGTAGHFIGVEVSNQIRLNNVKETFIDKIESNSYFFAKNADFIFFDKITSHNFKLEFENFELKVLPNNKFNFQGNLTFYYDYIEIYSGSAAFFENSFYLDTEESVLFDDNISFTKDSILSFRESFNNSTLLDSNIFDFRFGLDVFDDFNENLRHVKREETNSFLFELPVNKYNSSIMFYTDSDCNISKLKTSTALEYENTLLSINASNISFLDSIVFNQKNNNYSDITILLNSITDIFEKFNKEDGPGLTIELGDVDSKTPLSLFRNDTKVADLLGELTIYNKNDVDDFILNYNGLLYFYAIDRPLPDLNVNITLLDEVFYIDAGSTLKGSVKLSTIENIFDLNKDELVTNIKSLLFNLIDLMNINKSFDENYKFVTSLDVKEDSISTTICIPTETEGNSNTTIDSIISFENNKFKKLSFSDLTYQNYTLNNLSLSLKEEINEKQDIDTSSYRSYDEIIEKLINFN